MQTKKNFLRKKSQYGFCLLTNSSSFFSPWNLTTKRLTPYSGRLCQARMKFIFASNRLRSFTLACDSRIFWRNWKMDVTFQSWVLVFIWIYLWFHLPGKARGHIVLCYYLHCVGVDGRGRGRWLQEGRMEAVLIVLYITWIIKCICYKQAYLHWEEGFDGVDLCIVAGNINCTLLH